MQTRRKQMSVDCTEVTDAQTILGPGWEGMQNSGRMLYQLDVGHISLAASETYGGTGHYK